MAGENPSTLLSLRLAGTWRVGQRFWSKVQKSDGCWIWTGAVSSNGYGEFTIVHGTVVTSHRLSYFLAGGTLSAGQEVLHTCDNYLCVRPDHLYPGTQAENMRDWRERGVRSWSKRHPTAKLTADDVRVIRARLKEGEMHRLIASDFGVCTSCISHIARGARWSSIA